MKNEPIIDSLLHKTADLATQVTEKTLWAVFFTPAFIFIEKFIFSDWNFLIYLGVFISLDTLLGLGLALYYWQVSAKKFGGIAVKGIIYGPVLIIGHVFENFEVSGNPMEGGYYLKFIFYTGLLAVEGISIIKNLGRVNKKFVPLFILKRLEDFNESGDYTKLTGASSSNTKTKAEDESDH